MTDLRPAPEMTSPPRCPRCQTPLVGAGQCPGCLLQLAIAPAAGNVTGITSGSAGTAGAPDLDTLQPLFPDHELQTLIGRGGMGAVYRARHLKLDRLVAIKVLLPDLVQDPAFAERFEREARALARLDHPGIVGVHDFGRAGGFFFLVMEFVDGANLRDLLAHGQLTSRDVLQFVPQLCDALQYAHDHRVVHRDIKPENILIDQDGRVRIADFGLAKLLGQDPTPIGLTQTRQAVGTPHYMAPEQVHAPATVDHRADLYSLGVVLYEMLTGQLPIGRFAPPSAKAPDAAPLDPVVMRSLESDPAQRYQQAAEVKRDLAAEAAPGAPAGTKANGPAPAPRTPPRASDAIRAAAPIQGMWYGWLGVGLVFVSSFLDWIAGPIHFASDSLLPWAGSHGLVGQWDAWHSDIAGIPNWLVVPLAFAISVLGTMRVAGVKTPAGMPLLLTMAGTLFCGYELMVVAIDEEATARVGLILTLIVFLVWNAAELRRHGEATWRARRARATDRTAHRKRFRHRRRPR